MNLAHKAASLGFPTMKATVDLSALCFTGATVYLRHSWGVGGACKRCVMRLPPLTIPKR